MKRIFLILTSLIMMISLASCNKKDHTHIYDNGTVVKDAVCGNEKTVKYSCTDCDHSYSKTYTVEHNWEKATCTEPKTCTICKETDGEELGHSYKDNKCENCDSIVSINVTLPEFDESPINITNYVNGTQTSSLKITNISYEYTASQDDNVKLTVSISGEKTSDATSNLTSATCTLVYKLYDENGCVVASGTYTTPYLSVNDKFADKEFSISGLINGQNYELVLVDYYTTKY